MSRLPNDLQRTQTNIGGRHRSDISPMPLLKISPPVAVAAGVTAATTFALLWRQRRGETRRAVVSCECGKVQVQLYQPAANYRFAETPSFQCACRDCVGVCEKILDTGTAGETLNDPKKPFATPGIHNYILYDSEILVTQGAELLQSMKLTEKTPNRRIYSKCCGTPIGICVDGVPLNFIFPKTIKKTPLKDGEMDFPILDPYCCVYTNSANPKRPVEPTSMTMYASELAPSLIGHCIGRILLLVGLGARGPGSGFPKSDDVQIGLESIKLEK